MIAGRRVDAMIAEGCPTVPPSPLPALVVHFNVPSLILVCSDCVMKSLKGLAVFCQPQLHLPRLEL